MKFKKLLVLSAFWLTASSVSAEVPENKWTMPEPTGLEFTTFTDDGTRYYLYNPAAKMFFASGNGWNTQASLRTFGMEIWLQTATESDAPEGSYELWDNNVNNPARSTGEGNMFTDDGDATWVEDYIIVDKLHYRNNRGDILLHIWNLHIAYSAAWGQLLKFGFKSQLAVQVYF